MTENRRPLEMSVTDLDNVFSVAVMDKYGLTAGDAFADMFKLRPAVDALRKFVARERLAPASPPPAFTLHYDEVDGRPRPVAVARDGDYIDICDASLDKIQLVAQVRGDKSWVAVQRRLRVADVPCDLTAAVGLGASGAVAQSAIGIKPFPEPGAAKFICESGRRPELKLTDADGSLLAIRVGESLGKYQGDFSLDGVLAAMRGLWDRRETDRAEGGERFRIGPASRIGSFLLSLTKE